MSIQHEIQSVRHHAGLWARQEYTVLQCSGKDAVSWLHNQSTNEVQGLQSQQGNMQALLDRQGRVQCFFSLHRWENDCWIIIPKVQAPALLDRHETHCFLEEVNIQDVGGGAKQVSVEGPRTLLFLSSLLDVSPEETARLFPNELYSFKPMNLLGHDVLAFRMTESGEDGFLLVPAPEEAEMFFWKLCDAGEGYGVAVVSEAARETLRLEAGHPLFDFDIGQDRLISETPLEKCAISYSKGCYLGQEVVARVKAYTSPKWSLMGLCIDDTFADAVPGVGTDFLDATRKKIGTIRSSGFSPTLDVWIALAYLDREHRVPDTKLNLHTADAPEKVFEATVSLLPFCTPEPRETLAKQFYDEALMRFEADKEDEDESAIGLLKDAIVLSPGFEDAYEALGVILHRHHRVDEAIHYMQLLATLNPDCVMAHTNLSVFYVSKGMIGEAEAEKAIAGQLEQHQQLNAVQAEQVAEAERARIVAESEQRITMFREVLEIDPEDPIANMGLGSAYIQLQRYAEAIQFLEVAARVQKDYSAAWLNLGKCQEFLGQRDKAILAYTAGIAAASRKGDLMPMKEMQRRLHSLGQGVG